MHRQHTRARGPGTFATGARPAARRRAVPSARRRTAPAGPAETGTATRSAGVRSPGRASARTQAGLRRKRLREHRSILAIRAAVKAYGRSRVHRGLCGMSVEEALLDRERRLRRQNEVLVALGRSPALADGDLDRALKEITEAAAAHLSVARASVWRYRGRSGLAGLRRPVPGQHRLARVRHAAVRPRTTPAYFQALEEERTITAHHATGRSPHARAGRQLPAAAGHHLDAGRPHPAAGQDDRGAVPRTRRHAPGLVGRRAELRRLAGGLRVAGDRRRRSQERRAPAGRAGGRAGPVQRRAGTVRLGRLARPAGAAAHGAELRQPAAVALPGPAGRRRRPVHQPRGRGREADARVHQRAAGVLTRRTGRRQLGPGRRQPGGGGGGVQPGGPDRRDRRRGGARGSCRWCTGARAA